MKAEYINHMGDDLTVVNAARVSFDKESKWVVGDKYKENPLCKSCDCDEVGMYPCDAQLEERDAKLISYLARHQHFTPFTHAMVTLRETVPIFVARQRFKHTIGFSYNEVSRRYVDDPPEFYMPEYWRARTDNKKQGSGDELYNVIDVKFSCSHTDGEDLYLGDFHRLCASYYQAILRKGVAPEQARMVLPQSMYTSYYVTGSLSAWARAYKLRIDPHAQKEIQDLAKMWSTVIEPLFPASWKALTQ